MGNYGSLSDNYIRTLSAPLNGQWSYAGNQNHAQVFNNGTYTDYFRVKDGDTWKWGTSASGKGDDVVATDWNPNMGQQYHETTGYDPHAIAGILTKDDTRNLRQYGDGITYRAGDIDPIWRAKLADANIEVGPDGNIVINNLTRKQGKILRQFSNRNAVTGYQPGVSGGQPGMTPVVSSYFGIGGQPGTAPTNYNAPATWRPNAAQDTETSPYTLKKDPATTNGFDTSGFAGYGSSYGAFSESPLNKLDALKTRLKNDYGIGDASFAQLFGSGTSIKEAMNYMNSKHAGTFDTSALAGGTWGKNADAQFHNFMMDQNNYQFNKGADGSYTIGYKAQPTLTYLKRQGGTLHKFQEGGELNEIQQQFLSYLMQKYLIKDSKELDALIKQLASTPGDSGESKLKDEQQEFMQQMQQTQTMKNGAKVNYLRKLKGLCPEGYETTYYKSGGQICSKCAKKKAEKAQEGEKVSYFEKCGGKVKKKCNGGKAPKACNGKKF